MEKQYKSKKQHSMKNSSRGVKSTALLKILQKIIISGEGSVSYIFEDERITNVHENNEKKFKTEIVESRLHTNLPLEAIVKKTPLDLINMFETTMHDLGATRYIVS